MKKLFLFLVMLVFAVILVACDDASTEGIPDEYKDYFDKPQGQEVNLELQDLLELIAEASVTSITDSSYPIVKMSTAGLLQFVLNTEAQEDVDATNNNLYFDFAQTTHVQLGAYTDNVKVHTEITKFDLNMDFDLMSMYLAPEAPSTFDVEFTGGFYLSNRFAYYRMNLDADILGQERSISVKEKIAEPLPHQALEMPSDDDMPVDIPELDLDGDSLAAILTDELVGQIKTYKQNHDYTIDVVFNKAFIVTFVTNMYNEMLESSGMTQEEFEELVPSLQEILDLVESVVKDFNLRLRLEIKNSKLSKVAFYANIDIDFLKSQHIDKFEELEMVPISRVKLLLEDYFYAVEYVNTFPQFPDFSSYEVVTEPSFMELLEGLA